MPCEKEIAKAPPERSIRSYLFWLENLGRKKHFPGKLWTNKYLLKNAGKLIYHLKHAGWKMSSRTASFSGDVLIFGKVSVRDHLRCGEMFNKKDYYQKYIRRFESSRSKKVKVLIVWSVCNFFAHLRPWVRQFSYIWELALQRWSSFNFKGDHSCQNIICIHLVPHPGPDLAPNLKSGKMNMSKTDHRKRIWIIFQASMYIRNIRYFSGGQTIWKGLKEWCLHCKTAKSPANSARYRGCEVWDGRRDDYGWFTCLVKPVFHI